MGQEAESVAAWGPLQSDYVTPSTISNDGWRLVDKEGYDKPGFESENVTNEGYSTGSVHATKSSKGKDNTTFSANERLTFESLGFHAVGAFGKVGSPTEVVAPDSPDPGVYTQLFELLNVFVNKNLPSRTLASKIGEPVSSDDVIEDAKLPSMVFQQAAFTTGDNPDMRMAASWVGSGQLTEPSGVQFYGSGKDVKEPSGEHFIQETTGIFDLYEDASFSGDPISFQCDFRGVNIVIDENLDLEGGYWCGRFQDNDKTKGKIRGNAPTMGQKVQFDWTMVLTPELRNDFALMNKIKKGLAISAKLKHVGSEIITGHNHEATFSLAKGIVASREFVSLSGGNQGIRIVTTPMAIGNVMPLSLLLKTSVPNFNTYVG